MSDGKKDVEKIIKMIDEMEVAEPEKSIAKLIALMGGNPTEVLIAGATRLNTAKREEMFPKKPLPKDYTEVERILHEMLVENTGASPLDSGDVYGRHWEKNRAVEDFRKLPPVEVEADGRYVSVCISTFHYLRAFLKRDEVCEVLERLLYEFAERPENKGLSWLGVMVEFGRYLEEAGWNVDFPFNSFNWENALSQIIQGIIFSNEEGIHYVMLQIHNGCDVRGGYTKPRIFELGDEETAGDFLFGTSEITAECGCIRIYSDNCGYNWYDRFSEIEYETDENGFPTPSYWEWNEETKEYICKNCGEKVIFYNRFVA